MKKQTHGMKAIFFGALLGLVVNQTTNAAASLSTSTTTITIGTKSVAVYTLQSDGTPYYGTSGAAGFPSQTYQNTPKAVYYTYYIPGAPALVGSPTSPIYTPVGLADDFGVAYDGIPFDPLTSFCQTSLTSSTSNTCTFRLEARLQTTPSTSSSSYTSGRVSIDQHNAHSQSNGAYHYHGIPCGLIIKAGGSAIANCTPSATSSAWSPLPTTATVVGYARDGYPIVVQNGVYASYSVVSSTGSGRPAAAANGLDSTNALGNWSADFNSFVSSGGTTFTQSNLPSNKVMADFTYTGPTTLGTSSSKLGLCNEAQNTNTSIKTLGGATAAYVYYLTPNFPMVPRCLIGVTDGDTANAQGFYHAGSAD